MNEPEIHAIRVNGKKVYWYCEDCKRENTSGKDFFGSSGKIVRECSTCGKSFVILY